MPNPSYDKMKSLLKTIEAIIIITEQKIEDGGGLEKGILQAESYEKILGAFKNAYPKGL